MATITEAKAVKERHSARLLALPNVVGLGVGPRIRQGKPTREIAIKVFVSRIVAAEHLGPGEEIPKELEGIPTDIAVLAPLKARDLSGKESHHGSQEEEEGR